MSCDNSCGPLVVTLFTGVPGVPGTLEEVIGDVEITLDAGANVSKVVGIRERPVSATAPTQNQIYQYNGTEWVPVDFTAGTY